MKLMTKEELATLFDLPKGEITVALIRGSVEAHHESETAFASAVRFDYDDATEAIIAYFCARSSKAYEESVKYNDIAKKVETIYQRGEAV